LPNNMFGLRYGIEGWYFIVLLVIHLVVDRTEGIEGLEQGLSNIR